MTELDDHQLLAKFAGQKSEPAFAALAARYINLVYSAALRFAGNPHHAEEITQAVFIILARKAGGLRPGTILSGWLYQTTRLTAANFIKGEVRRQHREQEAYMQSTLNEPEAAAWEQIAPLLDEAMGRLGETDRNALMLRFFENKTSAEVAVALQLTEAAAHKRVSRALEKLRKFFGRRGVGLTAGIIAGAVTANSVQAAPTGLAGMVAASASQGAGMSTTITLLVKGTMKTMKWLQYKLAVAAGASVLLATVAVTVALSETGVGARDKLTAQEIAKQAQAAYAALSSYSDTGHVTVNTGRADEETTFDIRLQRPNLYRIEWSSVVGLIPVSQGVVWSEGTGDFFAMGVNGGKKSEPVREQNMQMALASATGVSSSAAATVPGSFFKQGGGDQLGIMASPHPKLAEVAREKDERVGGTDCFVVMSRIASMKLPHNMGETGNITTRLLIGKRDHLIHQSRTTSEGGSQGGRAFSPSGKIVFTETHENIALNKRFAPSDFAQ